MLKVTAPVGVVTPAPAVSVTAAVQVVVPFTGIVVDVQLTLVDDDHQLMASLPRIWSDMAAFLELT